MAVLRTGQAKYPFWSLPLTYITGLDPLGLQTTSEATYSFLLPGISNLTNRMRYYGFYCWLLNQYLATHKTATQKEQFRFIRRGEFLLALIMSSEMPGYQQVMGSNFTRPLVQNSEEDVFSISHGADLGEKRTTYWQFHAGAFGQYYLGALQHLELVHPAASTEDPTDFIYKPTEDEEHLEVSGTTLGNAYGENIPDEISTLFLRCIEEGSVAKDDFPILYEYFYLNGVDTVSAEWACYRKLLTGKDYPAEIEERLISYHRSQTIADLLAFSRDQNEGAFSWEAYLEHLYQEKPLGKTGLAETRTAWYYYQLNEYWHLSAGTIFWAMLTELKLRVQDQHKNSFTEEFAQMSIAALGEQLEIDLQDSTLEDILELIDSTNEEALWKEVEGDIKNQVHEKALGLGWLLLFTTLKNNQGQLQELKTFAEQRNTFRDGAVTEYFSSFLKQGKKKTLLFMREFTLRNLINRHQHVALRKMGNGTTCTFKFLVEEQMLRYREVFAPRKTSPRLKALSNLLYDLNIIEEDDQLSTTITF